MTQGQLRCACVVYASVRSFEFGRWLSCVLSLCLIWLRRHSRVGVSYCCTIENEFS